MYIGDKWYAKDYKHEIIKMIYNQCTAFYKSSRYEYRVNQRFDGKWELLTWRGFPVCVSNDAYYLEQGLLICKVPIFDNLTKMYQFVKENGKYLF